MSPTDSTNDNSIKTIGGIVVQVAGPALTMLVVYSIAAFLLEIGYNSGMVA